MAFREQPPPDEAANLADAGLERAPDALGLRLDALIARGAARFDPAEIRFLQGLLARAGRAPAALAPRLRARLDGRLAALDAALSTERARAHGALDRASRAGVTTDDLRGALGAGDPLAIALDAEARLAASWLARRGRARDPERASVEGSVAPGARLAELDALAAGLRLDLALARAASSARATEGPYNPTAIAARLFATLERAAPGYLSALARDLDDLGAVAAQSAEAEARAPKRKR